MIVLRCRVIVVNAYAVRQKGYAASGRKANLILQLQVFGIRIQILPLRIDGNIVPQTVAVDCIILLVGRGKLFAGFLQQGKGVPDRGGGKKSLICPMVKVTVVVPSGFSCVETSFRYQGMLVDQLNTSSLPLLCWRIMTVPVFSSAPAGSMSVTVIEFTSV